MGIGQWQAKKQKKRKKIRNLSMSSVIP